MPTLIRTLLLLLILPALSACQKENTQTVTLRGETMGTTYTVKYLAEDSASAVSAKALQNSIDSALQEVNRQMSTYQEDSEISRFNRMRQTGTPIPISDDFAAVVSEALRLNRLTQGALDVTVGPLVNLWGFGPDKNITREPDGQQIKQTSAFTGIDKITLRTDSKPATLSKNHPQVYLDLSSIAKGFGVDKAASVLEKHGIRNYLVEIGGELHGKGKNAQGEPWRVGIEQPNIVQGSSAQIVLPLDNRALATSGDYRIFHTDANGKRLSHIINPKTKRPIDHNLASVSVIADNATTADGLSTGLFVLGETEAMKLAETEKLAVFMIIRDKDGYHTAMSSEFAKLIR